jgi:hypothetical protein
MCRDALLDWRYAIKHKPSDARRPTRDAVTIQIAELASLSAQVRMVATEPTRRVAVELEDHLMSLRDVLYQHDLNNTPPKDHMTYRKAFVPVLDGFVEAAGIELGLRRDGS